jgi:hypothetical protein
MISAFSSASAEHHFRIGTIRVKAACTILFMALVLPGLSYSADLLVLRSANSPTADQARLDIASRFYGLNARTLTIDQSSSAPAYAIVRQEDTLAVAIEASALSAVNVQSLLQALHRASGNSVPVLIFGVTPQTDPLLISTWSGIAAIRTKGINDRSQLSYTIGRVQGITQQLGGRALPYLDRRAFYFALGDRSQAQEILSVGAKRHFVPTLIETKLGRQAVFLLCGRDSSGDFRSKQNPADVIDAFAAVAPEMMFVKYASGERGWHSSGHYANLTIDDPWLREPYGHVNYHGLLEQMEKHNFHTTIAFIPWNYDRSVAGVVSLFLNHPDRYSISVHGDNHDHKEFEDFHDKPESVQVDDLKQALARMDKFHELTGIPYDRVFVFPHSIGEKLILEKLKRYNYLATVNSTNVPMEGAIPGDPLFNLRSLTTLFGGLPSAVRYPAELANAGDLIAVNDFLDNPLFFYTHQQFFAKGIDAFDHVADEANRIDPATKWQSLGDIAEHLYLLRRGTGSSYDVLAFSSAVRLENTSAGDLVYNLVKPEPDGSIIGAVTEGSEPVTFKIKDGFLTCSVVVPAGQTRNLTILYRNDLNIPAIDISKRSLHVYLLRTASDFRDNWLSRFRPGEAMTEFYYQHNLTPDRVISLTAIAMAAVIGIMWSLLLIRRRKRPARVLRVIAEDKVVRMSIRESDRSEVARSGVSGDR